MILDTSFIIDLLRKDEEALNKQREMEKKNTGNSITSVSVYELWTGIKRSNASEKEAMLEVITSQAIEDLDLESSMEAGKIQSEMIEKGDRIGHMDALIAGIARENGEKILGRDKDFNGIEGLETENY